MAQAESFVLTEDDLTDADRAILDALGAGARTKGAIVDATGLHRNTVGNRLPVLEAGDAVRCIHDSTALYELRGDPREDTDASERDGSDEPATLSEGTLRSLRAALRALENGDPDVATARDELEAALEAIDE